MSEHVTVDARMLGSTGIGAYVEHVVPRVIARWTTARFTLLGNPLDLADFANDDRVTVRRFDAPIYSLREQALYPLVTPRDTDLFWAPHYNMPVAWRGALAVMVHDVIHLALPPASVAQRIYARRMFAMVRRRAEVVLCNSRFTAADFRARVGEPRALGIAPLGVDARWFMLDSVPAPPIPFFLYVGNVKPHKNLPRLIAGFSRVADIIPHRLVIVGPRDGLRTLDHAAAVAAQSLGDRVVFTGRLDHATLERQMATCHALLLPSLYEGFGLPALEALAVGRPVGASSSTVLPEVCGNEADYFDPLDIEAIAATLQRLAALDPDDPVASAHRRARARTFTWDRCAEVTHHCLLDALGRHRARR